MLPVMTYRMLARFSGRTNKRTNSGSCMEENLPHFGLDPLLGPIGMLKAQPGCFHFTARPIQLLPQPQPQFTRHGAERGYLLWAGLFIRQHASTIAQSIAS